jgi:hypothetical protein
VQNAKLSASVPKYTYIHTYIYIYIYIYIYNSRSLVFRRCLDKVLQRIQIDTKETGEEK